MNQLLLFGIVCALGPFLLALLHPLLGALTRALVYLLVVAQLLVVPVLVALDPGIDFGSETYSLGAGVGMILTLAIEMVFAAGSALDLLLAIAWISRRESWAANRRWSETMAQLEQSAPGDG